MLGVAIGLVMPDVRGVLFGSIVAIPLSLWVTLVVGAADRAAMGEPSLTPLLVALGVVLDWVVFVVIALAAYGLKRLLRPRPQ